MKKLIACMAIALAWGTVDNAIAAADSRCPKKPGGIKLEGVLHIKKSQGMSCTGAALMADDLQRELKDAYPELPERTTIWAHGTGTADTPRQSRFRCTIKSEVANESLQLVVRSTCKSASGRRWTYRMLF